MKGITYFDLIFGHDHLLTKPNTCAKFERNRRFELYLLLSGFLMDTLLTRVTAMYAVHFMPTFITKEKFKMHKLRLKAMLLLEIWHLF